MDFILHSAELHIGGSIKYENALYGNDFLNRYIIKIILISLHCFSEYSYPLSGLQILVTLCIDVRNNVAIYCKIFAFYTQKRDSKVVFGSYDN